MKEFPRHSGYHILVWALAMDSRLAKPTESESADRIIVR